MAGKSKASSSEIRPASALYIKLGRGGEWETECIFQDPPTLRFGYADVTHEHVLAGRWKEVEKELAVVRSDAGSITRDITQIRNFYQAPDDVLWVTFHGGSLWWCFSKQEITPLPDGSKTRLVIGKWSNTDIRGNALSVNRLRGSFLGMQGFRGTICDVKEFQYIVDKINARTPSQIEGAQAAYEALIGRVESLVKTLHWKDFELLVDLIFRGAGWKRLSEIGKTQKTLDLELLSPMTNEKILAQVKSTSDLREYLQYEKRFEDMEQGGYSRFFFIVHSPEPALENHTPASGDIRIVGPKEIARLSLEYGLVEWLLTKAD